MNIQTLNAVADTSPLAFALLVVATMALSGALVGAMAGAILNALGVRGAAGTYDEV